MRHAAPHAGAARRRHAPPTSTRILACVLACLGLAASAGAQVVFFDDFDGDALLPHWGLPRPEDWEYNVSNSMLNVTGLFYPSSPDQPSNGASMSALFASQTDFRVDARMGWEAGQNPHWLGIQVLGPGGVHVAQIGYRYDLSLDRTPVIYVGAPGAAFTMPAPPPGMYDFTITRSAARFDFLLNGTLIVNLPDISGRPAVELGLDFVGPFPGELGPLHVDRIRVVPAPSNAVLVAPVAIVLALRRTRLTCKGMSWPAPTRAQQRRA